MAKVQYRGTGRRKSSVARVRLIKGKGNITVNDKKLEEYFPIRPSPTSPSSAIRAPASPPSGIAKW